MLTLFRNLFAPPRHMILLIAAAWIGLALAEKRAGRHGIRKEDLNNLVFFGLVAFIIGGRLSFVLQNITAFTKSPLGILSINPDLFDPPGALAFAIITAIIYGQKSGLSLWPSLDALTPFMAILAIGSGLSSLAAGTSFGTETNLPWGMILWNATRHPTQIYEILASTATFVLLWRKKHTSPPGIFFLTFGAVTAGYQLFIGAYRVGNTLPVWGFKQDQVFAWFILAITFMIIELRLKSAKNG